MCRKVTIFIALVTSCGLLCQMLGGCDCRSVGPALPEVHAKEYLLDHGYDARLVETLLQYGRLDQSAVRELMHVPDVSVRHMLAQNSGLTADERALLMGDTEEFVVGGVAMNPSITQSEAQSLINKKSKIVLHGLAMNPFVQQDMLLRLRYEYAVPQIAFAQNPCCPVSIANEIQESGSSLEKDVLAISKAERRKGVYRGCKIVQRYLGSSGSLNKE